MTIADTIPGLDDAPSKHGRLVEWVREIAALTTPDRVEWCDGSEEEWDRITSQLVAAGTLQQLNPAKRPNSFYAKSDPADVARVESRTFICSETQAAAGPTNNWMSRRTGRASRRSGRCSPAACAAARCTSSRICMGPSSRRRSPHARRRDHRQPLRRDVNMRIMTRMGKAALARIEGDGSFVKGLHSVGDPLEPDQAALQRGRSTSPTSPRPATIWSYGSGYGGNALLGKKCYALRIASTMGRDEGWLAEHMLILGIERLRHGRDHLRRGGVPVGLRQDQPRHAGSAGRLSQRRLEGVDGRRRHLLDARPATDGRLWAINPEAGFFGVAPGTGESTNPNALATLGQRQLRSSPTSR